MPEPTVWITFVAAVLAMQTMPGPDMLLVVARGVGEGRRAAFGCVLGFAGAGIVQIPALALGLATVLQASPVAYETLRWSGAVYLVYTGLTYLISPARPVAGFASASPSAVAAFRQGFLNNLMNPKVLVFMLALLPQFVDPLRGPVALQFVLLGITMKCCGFAVNGTVALLSGWVGNWLSARQAFIQWQRRLVGTVLVGLGLRLALGTRS